MGKAYNKTIKKVITSTNNKDHKLYTFTLYGYTNDINDMKSGTTGYSSNYQNINKFKTAPYQSVHNPDDQRLNQLKGGVTTPFLRFKDDDDKNEVPIWYFVKLKIHDFNALMKEGMNWKSHIISSIRNQHYENIEQPGGNRRTKRSKRTKRTKRRSKSRGGKRRTKRRRTKRRRKSRKSRGGKRRTKRRTKRRRR